MMEPRIQYAKTSDGVNIAFWTLGSGPPVVATQFIYSHLQLEWQQPEIREWYERLAQHRMLVRFDPRGFGMSDRDVSDLSIDAQLRDLEAVVDRLQLGQFDLLSLIHGVPVSITYASQRPERISHLILWCGYTRASEWIQARIVQTVRGTVSQDWETASELIAHALLGWSAGVAARRYAELVRGSTTAQTMLGFWRDFDEIDVTELLANVRAPTLVLQRDGAPAPTAGAAKSLASGIPGARLVMLAGSSLAPYLGDTDAVLGAIEEFLTEARQGTAVPGPVPSAFRTVLVTDLVGHTEMMSRLGDERGREVLREHERITREVLKAHGGTEVKTMGDGFMASFGSVTRAVECTVALQRAIGNWKSEIGERIAVRCGLNAGEPIEEEGDLFGATVILASRIAAKAEGGEILVADTVRGLCSGKGFLFSDRGEFVAKGFEEPVRVYEVRWRE